MVELVKAVCGARFRFALSPVGESASALVELCFSGGRGTMNRERALKVVLVVVGLLFVAFAYPLVQRNQSELLQMFVGVYATLGVFLLIASRNPALHRSLIAFAAWSSLVHAAIMAVQSLNNVSERGHLLAGVALFGVIGILLNALAPARLGAAAAQP